MEGTYPLPEAAARPVPPEAQGAVPSAEDLAEIIERTTKPVTHPVHKAAAGPEVEDMKGLVREVPLPQPVKEYVSRLILSTRPDVADAPDMVRRFVRYGSSPRGAQALVMAARYRPHGWALQRQLRRHSRRGLRVPPPPADPVVRGRSGRDRPGSDNRGFVGPRSHPAAESRTSAAGALRIRNDRPPTPRSLAVGVGDRSSLPPTVRLARRQTDTRHPNRILANSFLPRLFKKV